MERPVTEGDSPVLKKNYQRAPTSRAGHVKPCLNMGGPSSKAKYYLSTDSELVP